MTAWKKIELIKTVSKLLICCSKTGREVKQSSGENFLIEKLPNVSFINMIGKHDRNESSFVNFAPNLLNNVNPMS